METKQCSKCQETKTLDQFHESKSIKAKDSHDYYCKYCRVGTSIQSKKTNKKKCTVSECGMPNYAKSMCRNHYSRFLRTGTTEKIQRTDEEKYLKTRETNLRYRYVLTLEQFNEMAKDGCNVCGIKPEGTLHVDHDHSCCNSNSITCGKCVRGVVCGTCNQSIGKYEAGVIRQDNPLIDKIKEYLHV
jgi:hypothetical protein